MKKIVIATNNKAKIAEFKSILTDYDVLSLEDIGFDAEIVEDGKTFKENAYLKAKAVYDFRPAMVVADDSGLEVKALNGEPGVHSARYAKNHDTVANNELLLKNLAKFEDRSARFVCFLCLFYPDGHHIFFEGYSDGLITLKPRGQNGFGYDPYFYSKDLGKTFAEASMTEKNLVSHRFRALNALLNKLEEDGD